MCTTTAVYGVLGAGGAFCQMEPQSLNFLLFALLSQALHMQSRLASSSVLPWANKMAPLLLS